MRVWILIALLGGCSGNAAVPDAGLHDALPSDAGYAPGPPFREYTPLVYDPSRQRMMLIAGLYWGDDDIRWPRRDQWEWDGTAWTEVDPGVIPEDRYRYAAAYDPARDRVVVHGGTDFYDEVFPQQIGDLWEWDGSSWSEIQPSSPPLARTGHTMVYHPVRGRVLMFGGSGNGSVYHSDVWEWDGTTWAQLPVVGGPTTGGAIAFDVTRGEAILFGNNGETWVWSEPGWELRTPPAAPSVRSGHATVYDAERGTVLLFGGGRDLDDTWEWDGSTWTERAPAHSPPGRRDHALGYDEARGRVVLFGGDRLEDTWEWDGDDWTRR